MRKNLLTVTLIWGFILGLALSLIQFLRTFSDLEYFSINPILDLAQFLAFVGVLLLGMKEYRDKILGGFIKFFKVFFLGVLIVLISFVIVVIYFTIQHNDINKEALNQFHQYTNSFVAALNSSVFVLAFGFLFALFVALYVYKENKTDENADAMIDENKDEIIENGKDEDNNNQF